MDVIEQIDARIEYSEQAIVELKEMILRAEGALIALKDLKGTLLADEEEKEPDIEPEE
jgi:hypothetical protein